MSAPRNAFVTGAASGIGRATVRRFHAAGWNIGAADLDRAGLELLGRELGERFTPLILDVTDRDAYAAALAAFPGEDGTLDLLFNNAGIGQAGWFEDIPDAAHRRLVEVNLVGVLHGIQLALPYLRRGERPLCFSTSSSSAIFGIARISVYSATKFAVKGLTEALSVEFSRHGVRVADVLPGLIDTAILDTTEHHPAPGEEAERRNARAEAPTEGPFRLIQPEEVAEAVWSSWNDDTGRLHWFVPPELEMIEKARAVDLEAMRDGWVAQIDERRLAHPDPGS